ncbi:MAG: ribosome recycling factor [Bacteroidales bacterium]
MTFEDVKPVITDCKQKMEDATEHLQNELSHIRAGKASTTMVEGVMVEYYGTPTPLTQVASVSTPDPRTIAIQPWEKQIIPDIERAIMEANLGFNPGNNGEVVRVAVPALTEERRKDLVKQANAEGEHAKVSIRNARKDANTALKAMVKDGLSEDVEKDAEAEVQKITDQMVKTIDEMVAKKHEDIMTV